MTGADRTNSLTRRPAAAELCPVCLSDAVTFFLTVEAQDYWRCQACEARYLDPRQHPSQAAEYYHYQHHENDPEELGYRRFLSRLADPLLALLPPGSSGLDFGCGPGPALAEMLREAGHDVALYDPFFHPSRTPLNRTYDFVTCTETAEHFHRPAEEFDRLAGLLRPGGLLAIMTCFQTEDSLFAGWHYRRDPTHVVFYRETTLHHLAAARNMSCSIPVKNVAILQKPLPETDR